MAEIDSAVRPKRWDTAKGARNAAIFGIATFPLDLLMHYNEHIGGLIRLCQVGRCGEQIVWLLGVCVGMDARPGFSGCGDLLTAAKRVVAVAVIIGATPHPAGCLLTIHARTTR